MTNDEDNNATSTNFGILVSFAVAYATLWIQCAVTEERFLPSLAAMCDKVGIPPSLASVTVMAVGSASPNVLAVLISVFVTKSDLGVGTIIGADMFQQLLVVSGVVFASRSRAVVLAPKMILREMIFYGSSLGILWYCLSHRVVPDENGIGRSHIGLAEGLVLLGTYGLYVLVCLKYDQILELLGCANGCGGQAMIDAIDEYGCGAVYTIDHRMEGEEGINVDTSTDIVVVEEEDKANVTTCRAEYKAPQSLADSNQALHGPTVEHARSSLINNRDDGDSDGGADELLDTSPQNSSGLHSYAKHSKAFNFIVESKEPLIKQTAHEPVANFSKAQQERLDIGDRSNVCLVCSCADESIEILLDSDSDDEEQTMSMEMRSHFETMRKKHQMNRNQRRKKKASMRILRFVKRTFVGTEGDFRHKLKETERLTTKEGHVTFSCTLWQLPLTHHDQAPLLGIAEWQRRWFTFSSDGTISSTLEGSLEKAGRGQLLYPAIGQVEIDPGHLVLCLHSAIRGGPAFVLMAPNDEIFTLVLEQLNNAALLNRLGSPSVEDPDHTKNAAEIEIEVRRAEFKATRTLLDYPTGSSLLGVLNHFFLYPLKFLLHFTIPDVRQVPCRHPILTRFSVQMATIVSAAWIIGASYFMCNALEDIGNKLQLPSAAMGSIFSAVGTSAPVLLSSIQASKQGLSNLAVSNTISSNTFNILVALGLPWTLFVLFASDDGYYGELEAEGLIDCIIILSASFAVLCVLVIFGRLSLLRWHAPIFIIVYVCYIVGIILDVRWKQTLGLDTGFD